MISAFRLSISIMIGLALLITPGISAHPRHEQTSPTQVPDIQPSLDSCERNDRREDACALAHEGVSGPFTFAPRGDQDWYRLDTGDGLATTITIRADAPLDLVVSITDHDARLITRLTSPTLNTTLPPEQAGPIVLQVENRSPTPTGDQAYTIEIRKILPAPTPDLPTLAPDALENNWDPAHASPIAVGVVYDLNFICPDPDPHACVGGDHDYLVFPIKAGSTYLITTFDLGPGVDTVLDLYLNSFDQPLLSNDDARPSGGLLSSLTWVAPRSGRAILRVAPRAGGMTAMIPANASTLPGAGVASYRLAIALAHSALARKLQEQIAEQTNAPTPTPTGSGPTGSAAAPIRPTAAITTTATNTANSAEPSGPAAQGDALKGQAITTGQTSLRLRPQANGDVIEVLPPNTLVRLIGKYYNLWVRVETNAAVLPGWILATDLRRATPTPETTAIAPTISPTSTPIASPARTPPDTPASAAIPTAGSPLRVVELAPLRVDERAAERIQVARAITVSLRMSNAPIVATRPATSKTATPLSGQALVGIRIQLVDAFGDLLAEAITPESGQTVLVCACDPQQALFVRVPALGVHVRVTSPQLQIRMPEVSWQP